MSAAAIDLDIRDGRYLALWVVGFTRLMENGNPRRFIGDMFAAAGRLREVLTPNRRRS